MHAPVSSKFARFIFVIAAVLCACQAAPTPKISVNLIKPVAQLKVTNLNCGATPVFVDAIQIQEKLGEGGQTAVIDIAAGRHRLSTEKSSQGGREDNFQAGRYSGFVVASYGPCGIWIFPEKLGSDTGKVMIRFINLAITEFAPPIHYLDLEDRPLALDVKQGDGDRLIEMPPQAGLNVCIRWSSSNPSLPATIATAIAAQPTSTAEAEHVCTPLLRPKPAIAIT